jgi:hypothetical protein
MPIGQLNPLVAAGPLENKVTEEAEAESEAAEKADIVVYAIRLNNPASVATGFLDELIHHGIDVNVCIGHVQYAAIQGMVIVPDQLFAFYDVFDEFNAPETYVEFFESDIFFEFDIEPAFDFLHRHGIDELNRLACLTQYAASLGKLFDTRQK